MCGICGSTADPRGDAARRMAARMTHRGPDDDGFHVDPSGVALGARRLSVIDVEGGHQPVRNEDGTVWAVLNGEIYNHRRLREGLRAAGHVFRSETDTEVLVHLYEHYGSAMVHALEGMYAFAVWDARDRELLLCRDRFGEKPLFYARDGGTLVFASELTALVDGLGDVPAVRADVVDAFLILGYVPGTSAIRAGVDQLAPGHLLRWSAREPDREPERYWTLPPRSKVEGRSTDHLVAELEEVFDDAVRSRLVADVPVGLFLSGGVDSTLVAAVAAHAVPGVLKTFTVGYDVGTVNELDTARAAAQALGTDHHEVLLTGEGAAAALPPLMAGLDQPLADPALVALHEVAGLARESVTVAVGGEGADELFGGYPRYRWLARADTLGRAMPAPLAAGTVRAGQRVLPNGRAQRLTHVMAPAPSTERHLDWVTDRRRQARSALYGERLLDWAASPTVVGDADACLADTNGDVSDRFMRLDQRRFLPDNVLMKSDRAGMLRSLEVRTPYLERSLAEFAASIPTHHHLRQGGKALLRRLLPRLLPTYKDRPKTAFRIPLDDWLRGPLAPLVDAQHEGPLVRDGWIDKRGFADAVAEHRAGRVERAGLVWHLLTLGLWLEGQGDATA